MKTKEQKNEGRHIFRKAVIALLVLGAVGSIFSSGKGKNRHSSEIEDSAVSSIDTDFDTTGYIKMEAEVLFDYGEYMGGVPVVTVITVKDSNSTTLKAETENNDSLFFSVNCEFDSKISPYQEGEAVTVAGTVKANSIKTTVLEHCTIIGSGEIAQELKNDIESQRQQGENFKQEIEAQEAAKELEEQNNYIAECIMVSYSDVERNPDSYDGIKISITGKVEQVSEGLFDSVTLRINCNGNIWYATYTRKSGESRIIEGDSITAYGECTGVTSYTTVLGAQKTIPSLKIKYYIV